VPPDGDDIAVEVRGLGKQFGAHQVLSDISFKVRSGATVCILGPIGSG
jgi:ABC-type Fe3+/spermidine/putrescine transport system ATPase subunit